MRRTARSFSFVILLAGCATQADGSYEDVAPELAAASLTLAAPERGVQLETRVLPVDPGEDIRFCEVVELPGSVDQLLYVERIEAASLPGVRDLIVSVADLGSATHAAMVPGRRVPCTRAGEAFGEQLSELVSSQEPYLDQTYPVGVGHVLRGGQRLALDYHVVGDAPTTQAALLKLNLHAADARAVSRLARTASFQNLTIYTPPGGRSSHLAECRVTAPLAITQLVRRTQSHGRGFRVWIAGGERDGELLWRSRSPSDSRITLRRPLQLAPGEGLRFQCDFVNDTDLELRYGVNASDETCTLNALYTLETEVPSADAQGCLLIERDLDGVARK
jgi:hypothetical protein